MTKNESLKINTLDKKLIKIVKQGYRIKKKNNTEYIKILQKDLTVKPYLPKMYGGNKKQTEDDSFPVYSEDEKYVYIPKFYFEERFPNIADELKQDKKNKIKWSYIKNKLSFNGDLRDYQHDIIKKTLPSITKSNGGLISLKCGGGKTVLSLYIATKLKVKTLVIVHKTFLLNQWKERIEQFTNAEIGVIRQDKIDIEGKDIVIGMLQSIAKDKYNAELFNEFGFVIFDEAHHAPSKHFSKALPMIISRYNLALSATPKRSDKLEKVLHWYFGPSIYKDNDTSKRDVYVQMHHYHSTHKNFRAFKMGYTGEPNLPKTITKIAELSKRNERIIKIIEEILVEDGRRILVLSDRVKHLEYLKNILDQKDIIDSDFYIGRMKQKDLDIAKDRTVLFGTYAMASEALDIPELNTLIMATSRRCIEQSVGRILRKQSGEIQPLIIDFADEIKCFQNQSNARLNFYRKKHYTVEKYDYTNDSLIKTEILCDKESNIDNIKITSNSNDHDNIDFVD